MQEVQDTGYSSPNVSEKKLSTCRECVSSAEQLDLSQPRLRLVVRNPGPSRLRKRTVSSPRSGGELAERLASRWTSAFIDEDPGLADAAATSVRQSERPLAPIVPLFPHRRP